MTDDQWALTVQVAAVLAAVVASIVALWIASRDRREAREVAARDRSHAIRQAKLLVDMDVLLRLSENLARGGGTTEKDRMGAEALALIGYIGEEKLPNLWRRKIEKTDAELGDYIDDGDNPQWSRDSVEVQLALRGVVDEIQSLT